MKKQAPKIASVRYFPCGQEEFDFTELFINSEAGKQQLPVNVLLVEHRKLGNMLINTGCAETLKKNPALYAKYRLKHKLEFHKKDSIIAQLEQESIDPVCIKRVLLTHTSPECCGALPLLQKYELISSAQVMCLIKLGRMDEDMMKSTMPKKSVPILAAGIYNGDSPLKPYFKWVFDVLGDGSVLGVDLRGHTKEMMGFYFTESKLFYAADAAVDESVLEEGLVPSEKLLELQAYPDEYLSTLTTLRRLHREQPDIRFVFLHSKSVYEKNEDNDQPSAH